MICSDGYKFSHMWAGGSLIVGCGEMIDLAGTFSIVCAISTASPIDIPIQHCEEFIF